MHKAYIICFAFFLLVFIPFSPLVFADERPSFGFDFETHCGVLFSTGREFVLTDGKNTLSRLDWPAVTPYISFTPRLHIYHFVLKPSIISAVPTLGASDKMEDFDFFVNDADTVSHYSQHDLYLDKYYNIAVRAGYQFTIKQIKLDITPMAGFFFFLHKWTAANGYVQYPAYNQAWTGAEEKQNVSGTVITYEQTAYAPFIALETRLTLSNFKFVLSADFSPYIWAYSLDTHFARNLQFYDTMDGGRAGSVSLSALYYLPVRKTADGGISADNHLRLGFGLSCAYEGLRSSIGATAFGSIGLTESTLITSKSNQSKLQSDEFRISLIFVVSSN